MALKLIYGGGATAGAANGTLVSSGNPIVFPALDTPVACFIRADDDTYSPDASFSPPSDGQVQVSFAGTGGPWYAFGTNPNAYGADIADLNVAIHLRQHANASASTGLLQTDYTTNPNATAAPNVASLTVSPGNTQLTLTWTDVANDSGYLIERSPNGSSSWTTLATKAANSNSHTDTGLTNGTPYYYRITTLGTGRYKDATTPATGNGTPSGLASGLTSYAFTGTNPIPVQPGVGPDGKIWTPLSQSNGFARTAIDGTTTQFSLTTGTGPIHCASDGTNVWVACVSGHLVKLSGSLSGTPTQTAYNITAAYGIVLGPDGYLYVSGGDATIRKIDPSNGSLVTAWGSSGVATLSGGDSIRFGCTDGTYVYFADRTKGGTGAIVRVATTGASPLTATSVPDSASDVMQPVYVPGTGLFMNGQANGKIYPITTGTTQTFGTAGVITSGTCLPTGLVYNSTDGKLYTAGYNSAEKKLWALPPSTLVEVEVATLHAGAGAWGLCHDPVTGTVWIGENTSPTAYINRFVP